MPSPGPTSSSGWTCSGEPELELVEGQAAADQVIVEIRPVAV